MFKVRHDLSESIVSEQIDNSSGCTQWSPFYVRLRTYACTQVLPSRLFLRNLFAALLKSSERGILILLKARCIHKIECVALSGKSLLSAKEQVRSSSYKMTLCSL